VPIAAFGFQIQVIKEAQLSLLLACSFSSYMREAFGLAACIDQSPLTIHPPAFSASRRIRQASNKIELFLFTMTSISTNFDRTKTYPGESCPFFTGILRSLYFR
jgi:hypothetical protein